MDISTKAFRSVGVEPILLWEIQIAPGIAGRQKGFPEGREPHPFVDRAGTASAKVLTAIFTPALKDKLWHDMRADLSTYIPEVADTDLLMCCTCGRFLPYSAFTIEHLIPQQAVKDDPPEVKARLTIAQRSGVTLLCQSPLALKRHQVARLGCNAWKGRFYDTALREIFNGRVFHDPRAQPSSLHNTAVQNLGFLAMVREFGYQVALTPSGHLSRHQFFSPGRFVKGMPDRCQMFLAGARLEYQDGRIAPFERPFWFTVEPGACVIGIRNFSVIVPLSRDPGEPIARHLAFAPSRFKMRPDYTALFD